MRSIYFKNGLYISWCYDNITEMFDAEVTNIHGVRTYAGTVLAHKKNKKHLFAAICKQETNKDFIDSIDCRTSRLITRTSDYIPEYVARMYNGLYKDYLRGNRDVIPHMQYIYNMLDTIIKGVVYGGAIE